MFVSFKWLMWFSSSSSSVNEDKIWRCFCTFKLLIHPQFLVMLLLTCQKINKVCVFGNFQKVILSSMAKPDLGNFLTCYVYFRTFKMIIRLNFILFASFQDHNGNQSVVWEWYKLCRYLSDCTNSSKKKKKGIEQMSVEKIDSNRCSYCSLLSVCPIFMQLCRLNIKAKQKIMSVQFLVQLNWL